MTTTVKALQKLTVSTMQGGRVLDIFAVEPGESFDLLTGNGYHTSVQPAQVAVDEALADYGWGAGDPREASRRVERHTNHMAAGRDINAGPYGKLYE